MYGGWLSVVCFIIAAKQGPESEPVSKFPRVKTWFREVNMFSFVALHLECDNRIMFRLTCYFWFSWVSI